MEWLILFDPSDMTYNISADYRVLVNAEGSFWMTEFKPTQISRTPFQFYKYSRNKEDMKTIHSFISDDPINYVYNILPLHFPELFI